MFARLKSLFPARMSPQADECLAFKKQGDEHLKGDRLDDAAGCYRRAVTLCPDNVDACVGLGFVLSEQKQYPEAERYLRHALAIDPGNADAHYILGTMASSQNDQAASIDHYSRALESNPNLLFAYRELHAALFRSGQVQQAKDVLQRAISAYPESAEFQFYLGNLLSHDGDNESAVGCYTKALTIQPGSAESHKSLADALGRLGRFDQAVAHYQKAVWFEPNFVDAHLALGGVLQSQGKLDQAVASYGRVAELEPEHAGARISLGNALESLGRGDEAIACYRRAVALEPEHAAAHQYLGNALVARGETEEAVACYRQVMRLDPTNAVQHLIAALSGGATERAPSEYVEKLFDDYAHKFDKHLQGVLSYSVPERLAEALRPHVDPGGEKWTILDLGCGTGLSGAAVAPYARQLVGVDLSAKMLERARDRNLYHRLEQLDLLTMMQGEAASTYDVVIAADVFVYLGRLDELVDQAGRMLRPGGLFAFSVESLEALADDAAALPDLGDYRLNVTGRYAHSIAYLARMAGHSGFDVLSTTNIESRVDKGKAVQGYLALWRRPSA